MHLVRLELDSIRSYRSGTVEFPSGIVLLSGDIGSGKSTLLLAAEFALFGLSRGELAGSSLLRHGADSGSATLTFSVHGATCVIHRTLKRSKTGVVQDTGWIEFDGQRESLTATEMKAKIFSLLGYPLQFLGKKNLLYRFTLYTPQEEMKAVLSQSASDRVEAVRRVFGVDAYKRAQDNAQLLVRDLKGKNTDELVARVSAQREHIQETLTNLPKREAELKLLEEERAKLGKQLSVSEAERASLEIERAQLEQKRQMRAMQERQRSELVREIKFLSSKFVEKHSALVDMEKSITELTQRLSADVPELATAEAKVMRLQSSLGAVKALSDQAGVLVNAGEICPTCRQTVSEEHVHSVTQEMEAKKTAAEKKRVRLQDELQKARDIVTTSRSHSEVSRTLKERNERVLDLTESVTELQKLKKKFEVQLAALPAVEKQDDSWSNVTERYEISVLSTEKLRREHLELERRIAALVENIKGLDVANKELDTLTEELALLQKEQKSRQEHVAWLTQKFQPFAGTIERHVLSAVHRTFDVAVREWFAQLVEDDALSVSVDASFTPNVQQQGYDIESSDLSGGERTALALAYRLGLVHTIHMLMPDLATAGLLILDEPTDGFSSEQLDRVRDVLAKLDMNQIIIVSHEQQLEGFVDYIIRVEKTASGSVAKSL